MFSWNAMMKYEYLTFWSQAVTLLTTRFNIQKVCMVLTMHFMFFLWILRRTATFAIYCVNILSFVNEVETFTAQLLHIMLHYDFCSIKFFSAQKLKKKFSTISLIVDRLHCLCKLSGDSLYTANGCSTHITGLLGSWILENEMFVWKMVKCE
jgi:hypothetical protein